MMSNTGFSKFSNCTNIVNSLYGGIGDGYTDNTTTLLSAIAGSRGSGNNACVYFPIGRYSFAGAITI
jgi:hypothetical protein